jgi:hypothetical protein
VRVGQPLADKAQDDNAKKEDDGPKNNSKRKSHTQPGANLLLPKQALVKDLDRSQSKRPKEPERGNVPSNPDSAQHKERSTNDCPDCTL